MKKFLIPAVLLGIVLVILLWRIITTSGEFAGGVSVDRWRIGGLTKQEASELLARTRAEDVRVRIGGKTVAMPASQIKPRIEETLKQIPPASLSERIFGIGGEHYQLSWSAKEKHIRQTHKRAMSLQTSPREARWVWKKNRWQIDRPRPGIRVFEKALLANIKEAARAGGGATRKSWKKINPDFGVRQLKKQTPTQLLVDQSEYKLYVYRHGRLRRTYSVAVGAPGFDTPNGNWTIIERTVDPAWLPPDWAGEQAGIVVPGGTPENPLVSRWMGIGDGVGIHGTRDVWSLGSRASRGCIRMDPKEVEELYEDVPLGTPLRIQS